MDILTIDNHSIFRLGIQTLLQAEKDLNPVGEADSMVKALDWLARNRADVALLDNNLPDRNGIDGMSDMLALQPDLKIVMLSMHDGVDDVVRAFRKGACSYVLKDVSPQKLLREIRASCGQNDTQPATALTGTGDKTVAIEAMPADAPQPAELRVTPRETKLLSCLCQGLSNKEIARELGLSPNTVRNQLQRLQGRFRSRNRVQLALFARETGCAERALKLS